MAFVNLIAPNQGESILGQFVYRAKFRLHLELSALSMEIEKALVNREAQEVSRLIFSYLNLAGLDPSGLGGVDLLFAYSQVLALNEPRQVFAFQTWQGSPEENKPPYHFKGRFVAWWIHKLALFYGWSRAEITEGLYIEEAAAYLQEIMIYEADEADRQRALSELGYRYDKAGKGRFVPAPRPSWMVEKERKTVKIRKDMIPLGVVIDLNSLH